MGEDTGKEFIFTCKCTGNEELEEVEEVEENTVELIAGKINATGAILYWKNEIYKLQIGDYAIVENKGGYDLIKVVGVILTTEENAHRFSNTLYKNMKNVVEIVQL